MAVLTIKRVDAALELIRACLPKQVDSDGDFEDWNVIAPALVSIVGDLFEGIASCTPPRGRIRAEILARSLAEYAIAFAWLAGSEDDRPARIKSLLRDEFKERNGRQTSSSGRLRADPPTGICSTGRNAKERFRQLSSTR